MCVCVCLKGKVKSEDIAESRHARAYSLACCSRRHALRRRQLNTFGMSFVCCVSTIMDEMIMHWMGWIRIRRAAVPIESNSERKKKKKNVSDYANEERRLGTWTEWPPHLMGTYRHTANATNWKGIGISWRRPGRVKMAAHSLTHSLSQSVLSDTHNLCFCCFCPSPRITDKRTIQQQWQGHRGTSNLRFVLNTTENQFFCILLNIWLTERE